MRSLFVRRAVPVLAASIFTIAPPLASAAAAVLDSAFGAGGIAASPGFIVNAATVQADGKTVVTGRLNSDFGVARYHSDGTLDTGFGGTGIVQVNVSSTDAPWGVAEQADGKLLVAGRSTINTIAVVRLLADGTVDTAFGTSGIASTPGYGAAEQPIGFALQPDGKILVSGSVYGSLSSMGTLLARFDSNGALDNTFGTAGRVEGTKLATMPDWWTLVLQADGKIVVTGCASRGFGGGCGEGSFNVARYSSAGVLDSSFGTAGVANVNVSSATDSAYALAVQADGKILAVGRSGNSAAGSKRDFSVYRFNSNGTLDTGFDGDGLATVDVAGGDDELKAVRVLPTGKILAAGTGHNGTDTDAAVLVFNADGTADNSFGSAGLFTLDGGAAESLRTVALRNDGSKAVIGGSLVAGITLNDADLDGIDNATDTDDDNDGIADGADNCQYDANADQADLDGDALGDALGDACDDDRDGDGIGNAAETAAGTNPDLADSDGDGVADASDLFPLDNTETADNDLDGTGDNADSDDDNDGIADVSDPYPLQHAALDPDFGNRGYTVAAMGSGAKAYAMLREPDGKLVLVGDKFSMARFNADGTLDTGFAAGGKIVTPVAGGAARNVLRQADGKLVVAGSSTAPKGMVWRYTAAGVLDTTFSGDGKYNDDDRYNVVESVQQQPDGKLLLVGGYTPVLPPLKSRVTRLNTDGSVDTGYAAGGFAVDAITGCSDMPLGSCPFVSALQADGKLVIASGTAIARLNADGSPDTGFSADGKTSINAGSNTRLFALAVQQDGKLVLAGRVTNGAAHDVLVARLLPDGTPDTTFDGDGYAIVMVAAGDDQANAVAIQPNQRIVVAGVAHNGSNKDLFVARLHQNGQQDKSYYGNGVAIVDILSDDQAAQAMLLDDKGSVITAGYHGAAPAQFLIAKFGSNRGHSVSLQADGKALVAGSVNGEASVGVVRYNTDGSIDSSFANDGKQVTDFGSSGETADDSLVQADGKLLVVGTDTAAADSTVAHMARYNPDGSLDTGFADAGLLNMTDGAARAVVQQADGKLVTAGRLACGGDYCPGVMRLLADGSLDSAFATGGKQVHSEFAHSEFRAVTVQAADQKILAAGSDSNTGQALLVRLLPDGSPDSGFGSGGVVTLAAGSGATVLESLSVQADGRIVAAGRQTDGSESDVVLVRLLPGGAPDNSFAGDGVAVLDLGSAADAANAVLVQADGVVLAAGVRDNGTDLDAIVLRVTAAGALDAGFDGDGIKAVPGSEDEQAEDMVLSQDGTTVMLAGSSGAPSQFMLAQVAVVDTDGDGQFDDVDNDDDNDGIADIDDAMPLDTDNDGKDNAVDDDDDGDGIPDALDAAPLLPLSVNGAYRGSFVREQKQAQ